MTVERRIELVIGLRSLRRVRSLKKYGSLKYFSRRMHYAIIYVDFKDHRRVENRLRRLRFVKSVRESPLASLAKQLVAKTVKATNVEDEGQE